MYAEGMSDGHWVGLIGGVGGLAGTVAAAVVLLWNAVKASSREAKKDEVANLQAIIDRQEKQMGLLQAEVREDRELIAALIEDNASCEGGVGEMYGWMRSADAFCRRAAAVLKAKGADIGDPEPLPPRPPRRERPEFIRRTAAHNSAAVQAAVAKLEKSEGSCQP
jgi:hypothetical protein